MWPARQIVNALMPGASAKIGDAAMMALAVGLVESHTKAVVMASILSTFGTALKEGDVEAAERVAEAILAKCQPSLP